MQDHNPNTLPKVEANERVARRSDILTTGENRSFAYCNYRNYPIKRASDFYPNYLDINGEK